MKTLNPTVPAAIARASEETAMDVSFQCFFRMRRENRILDQIAMFAPFSEPMQMGTRIYHDLVPVRGRQEMQLHPKPRPLHGPIFSAHGDSLDE